MALSSSFLTLASSLSRSLFPRRCCLSSFVSFGLGGQDLDKVGVVTPELVVCAVGVVITLLLDWILEGVALSWIPFGGVITQDCVDELWVWSGGVVWSSKTIACGWPLLDLSVTTTGVVSLDGVVEGVVKSSRPVWWEEHSKRCTSTIRYLSPNWSKHS